jgi:hypothetical protein
MWCYFESIPPEERVSLFLERIPIYFHILLATICTSSYTFFSPISNLLKLCYNCNSVALHCNVVAMQHFNYLCHFFLDRAEKLRQYNYSYNCTFSTSVCYQTTREKTNLYGRYIWMQTQALHKRLKFCIKETCAPPPPMWINRPRSPSFTCFLYSKN